MKIIGIDEIKKKSNKQSMRAMLEQLTSKTALEIPCANDGEFISARSLAYYHARGLSVKISAIRTENGLAIRLRNDSKANFKRKSRKNECGEGSAENHA